ncbi:hypothetical protein FUAX_29690 [Fulvitalea axinellae]|uniref:DUF983 domain-containing protein n=2 Tax=Fulvitalea axinellae TaxID=1182444 RepID=A0AAU9CYI8_9BACT|nr:hypothetical protein FUAX_29690 [Fulvitalea axinellae]
MYVGFLSMHHTCPECGLRFEREPGFFFGAMYISYAFNVAIFVCVTMAIWLLGGNFPLWVHIATVFIVAGLCLPFVFRYSRVLYLYWFGGVKHKPQGLSA